MAIYFVELDHHTGIRIGATGTFQVISLRDEDGLDCSKWVDQGTHYTSLDEIAADIAKVLGVPQSDVEVVEA